MDSTVKGTDVVLRRCESERGREGGGKRETVRERKEREGRGRKKKR